VISRGLITLGDLADKALAQRRLELRADERAGLWRDAALDGSSRREVPLRE